MRPWLVLVGMVFLTIAVGTAVTYYAASTSPTSGTTYVTPIHLTVAGNATESYLIAGGNGSTERLSFSWSSTAPVRVALSEPGACTGSGPCSADRILANWTLATRGNWSASMHFTFPIQCVFVNENGASVSVDGTARAWSSATANLPLTLEVAVLAGVAALSVVAGAAIFLGLFLRADPYGPGTDGGPGPPEPPDEGPAH